MRAAAGLPSALLVALSVVGLVAGCAPATQPTATTAATSPAAGASVVPSSGGTASGVPSASVPSGAPSASTTPGAPSAPVASGAPATPADASQDLPTTAPVPSPTAAPAATGTVIVRAYFLIAGPSGDAGLVPVLREIPATAGVAAAAVRELIAGPNASERNAQPAVSSDVPADTRLLGLAISKGLATVDLSSEFAAGMDPAKPSARVAQLLYALTQFSTVGQVAFELNGQPVSGWPATRAAATSWLPAIFVDRPAWGAAAGNPARVSGTANVFEAVFRAQIRDAAGTVLADQQVQAACGTGCWGDFSTTLGYAVGKGQWGTLRVYDLSAKDGTPVHVVDYPTWLTPAG